MTDSAQTEKKAQRIEFQSIYGPCYIVKDEVIMKDGMLEIPVHSPALTALTSYDTREQVIKIASDEFRMYNPSFHWEMPTEHRGEEFVIRYRIKPV